MKFFFALTLVVIVVAVSGDVELKERDKDVTTCIKEHNVSEEEDIKLRNTDFTNPSENMKCAIKCFVEKKGIFNDGEVQTDLIPMIIIVYMEKCRSDKRANSCDGAFKFYECYTSALIQVNSNEKLYKLKYIT